MPTTLTDAMRDLLDGRRYAILATQNEDGSIHLTPAWYLFADGRFYADSLSTDRKARNVAARPGATIIVDVRQPGGESWVSAAGTAQLVQGDESQEINTRIVRRYLTDAAMNDARIGPAFTGAADATICVTPEVWRTWRLRDMDDQFFGGMLARTPDQWFRPVEA